MTRKAVGRRPRRIYRIAREPWEFERIHRLNSRTFVEEIPQHPPNRDRRLVDSLLARSTPFVCLERRRLIGMVMISGERPFSLDRKLPALDTYLPPASKPCEVRLLMVEPRHRRGRVFGELLVRAARWGRTQGYDLALISATLGQMNLYHHLSFVAFGPPIGTVEAPFQAMYVTWDRVPESVRRLVERPRGPVPRSARSSTEPFRRSRDPQSGASDRPSGSSRLVTGGAIHG